MELGDSSRRRASSRRPIPRASRIARRRDPSAAGTSPAFSTGSFSSTKTRLESTCCLVSPTTNLAVDQRPGHDQEALEDVLPFLIQAQEHGRVQHLDAQSCPHQRSDEGASPAEKAGASENNGCDRCEGITGALPRVADAELCKKDDGAEQGEE